MGSTQAMGMAENIQDELSLIAVLRWHLQGNHYPPLPISLVQTCIDAINACNEGEYEKWIDLPEGFSYKRKGRTYVEGKKVDKEGYPMCAPANEVVDWLHLEFYLLEVYPDEGEW